MQENPQYTDVTAEVEAFLAERIVAAEACGIPRNRILIDPGFGFGKTLDHNLTLLRNLAQLTVLDAPLLIGTSRKRMLGDILDVPPGERLYGTLATVAAAIERGAAIVRVHDVLPAVHVAKVMAAIHGRAWA